MKRSSRKRLHPGAAINYPGDTVHDRVARALASASCIPRKEFFESWSFVNRIRRHIDADVVWDLCAGHGLVAFLLALLEPQLRVVRAIDKRKPLSFERMRVVLAPLDEARVAKVSFEEVSLGKLEPPRDRVFLTAVHACGRRTDEAIEIALAARSSIAVLPCCHDVSEVEVPEAIRQRWSKKEAVDIARIYKLHAAGWRTLSRKVDEDVTQAADAIIALAPLPGQPLPPSSS
ncbi:MAG TPA: methyltransferase [Planctomycetota bacterium]|nr:methyltransferase [Planctomycetota bacterium]